MATPVAAVPNRLGVVGGDLQGYPNGRRLVDDVVDIEVLALQGAARGEPLAVALAGGDLVNANQKPFLNTFPYVATANNQAVNAPGSGVGLPPAVPSVNGGPWLPIPMGAGLAALALIGTGFWMLRRRPEPTAARVRANPAVN
jgi:hypothetical protein